GITEGEDKLVALNVRLVTDADEVKLFREAFRNAYNGVVRQCTCQTVERAFVVILAFGRKDTFVLAEFDAVRNRSRKCSLRPFYLKLVVRYVHRHTRRYRDRFFSYS